MERLKDLENEYLEYLRIDKKYSENLKKKKKFSTLHAFIHPYEALINSNTYFNNLMNERVENAILVHMFPLSLFNKVKLPKYKESWIITYIDKAVSLKDFPNIKEIPKYLGLKNIKNKNKK